MTEVRVGRGRQNLILQRHYFCITHTKDVDRGEVCIVQHTTKSFWSTWKTETVNMTDGKGEGE